MVDIKREAQSGEDELSRKTRLSLNLHLLRPHHCPTISPRPPIALICLFSGAREAFSGSFRLLLTVFHPRSPSHSQNGQAHLHDRHPDQAPQRSAGALHSLILLFRLLDGRAGCPLCMIPRKWISPWIARGRGANIVFQ